MYGRSGLIKFTRFYPFKNYIDSFDLTFLFTSPDMAKRALKRLNGEDVFGNRIIVSEKNAEADITSPKKRRAISNDDAQKYGSTNSYASALTKGKVMSQVNSRPIPRDGIKLTITNIDTALGEENIRQMMFTKIGNVCELMSLEIKPYNRFTMTADVIVPCMKNATDILQSMQRSKLGKKRILVTLTQHSDMRFI